MSKFYMVISLLALIMQFAAMFVSQWPFAFFKYGLMSMLLGLFLIFLSIYVPISSITFFSKSINKNVPLTFENHLNNHVRGLVNLGLIALAIYIIFSAPDIIDYIKQAT